MARPQLGGLPSNPTTIAFGDSPSPGAAGENAALSGHRHGMAASAPAHTMASHSDNTFDGTLTPNADGTLDIGVTATRFRDTFLRRSIDVLANTTAGQTQASVILETQSDTLRSDIYFERARDNAGSPEILSTGDEIGWLRFYGYDGATYREAARIHGESETAVASDDMGGALVFHTRPDGVAGALTERWRITNDGHLRPEINNTYNIGTNSQRVLGGYFRNFVDVTGNQTAGQTQAYLMLETQHDTNRSDILFRRTGDNAGAAELIAAGEELGWLRFYGYDGASYREAARIAVEQSGTAPGSDDMGASISFSTRPDGVAGALTTRWQFDNDGHLIPWTDSVYDIGTSSVRVRKVYADEIDTTAFTGPSGPSIRLAQQNPSSFTVPTDGISLMDSRVTMSGSNRGTLAGAGRMLVQNPAPPDRSAFGTGSFTVYDDDRVRYYDRIRLGGNARLTARGNGRVLLLNLTPNHNMASHTDNTFDGALLPDRDAWYDIGSDTARWTNLFLGAISDTLHPIIYLDRADAGPGVTDTDDMLGEIKFRGWDGTTYSEAARIYAKQFEVGGSTPAALYFATTESGPTATDRWSIDAFGDLFPMADSSYDIGTNALRPNTIYANTLYAFDIGDVSNRANLWANSINLSGAFQFQNDGGSSIGSTSLRAGDIHAVNLNTTSLNLADIGSQTSITFQRADVGPTLIDDNDVLGVMVFNGYDGASYVSTAEIRARIDGVTGASGDLPTELVFATHPDGTSAMAERWRISPAGHLEPMTDSTYDIGTTAIRVRKIWADDIDTAAFTGPVPAHTMASHSDNTFDGTLLPNADNTLDIGAVATKWRDIFTGDIYLRSISDTVVPEIVLERSDAGPALVDDNEVLGRMLFRGYDGAAYTDVAEIRARVDGTTGASGDVPTELVFATHPDGTSAMAERWRISPAGNLEPMATEVYAIGSATFRAQRIYATSSIGIKVDSTSAGTSPELQFERYRSAGLVSDNDETGELMFGGHDGSLIRNTAGILARVDGAASAGNVPQELVFLTGTTTSPVERWRIAPTGFLEPMTNGLMDLGSATNTIRQIFASDQIFGGGLSLTHSSAPGVEINDSSVAGADQTVGNIWFEGNNFLVAKIVAANRVGTPASGDSPGALEFHTVPDGSSTATRRWSIEHTGHLLPFADATYDIGSDALKALTVNAISLNSPVTNILAYNSFI